MFCSLVEFVRMYKVDDHRCVERKRCVVKLYEKYVALIRRI